MGPASQAGFDIIVNYMLIENGMHYRCMICVSNYVAQRSDGSVSLAETALSTLEPLLLFTA